MRKFYDLHVEGEKKSVNPGYANMVDATMSSIGCTHKRSIGAGGLYTNHNTAVYIGFLIY